MGSQVRGYVKAPHPYWTSLLCSRHSLPKLSPAHIRRVLSDPDHMISLSKVLSDPKSQSRLHFCENLYNYDIYTVTLSILLSLCYKDFPTIFLPLDSPLDQQ